MLRSKKLKFITGLIFLETQFFLWKANPRKQSIFLFFRKCGILLSEMPALVSKVLLSWCFVWWCLHSGRFASKTGASTWTGGLSLLNCAVLSLLKVSTECLREDVRSTSVPTVPFPATKTSATSRDWCSALNYKFVSASKNIFINLGSCGYSCFVFDSLTLLIQYCVKGAPWACSLWG